MHVQSLPRQFAALALAIALGGCVRSVDPIVPESGVTFDPRLLGRWANDSARAVITRGEKASAYAIEYTSEGSTGQFEARLGKLGNHTVLDVWPSPREHDIPRAYEGTLVAGHLLIVVEIGRDEFRAAALDEGTLWAALKKREVKLIYSGTEHDLTLHGTTAQLRAALGPHLARPKALGDTAVWRRVQGAEGGSAWR